jgi:hypothetical protein
VRAVLRAIEVATVSALVLNLLALGLFLWLRPRVGLYGVGDRFPIPAGLTADGQLIPKAAAPCYLIRVATAGCPYCRQDKPLFDRLLGSANRAHCEAIALVPSVTDLSPSLGGGGLLQLVYVDMGLARELVPYVVPQTLILGRDGSIIWEAIGATSAGSITRAQRLLSNLR